MLLHLLFRVSHLLMNQKQAFRRTVNNNEKSSCIICTWRLFHFKFLKRCCRNASKITNAAVLYKLYDRILSVIEIRKHRAYFSAISDLGMLVVSLPKTKKISSSGLLSSGSV